MHSVTSGAVAEALASVLARSNVRTGYITGGSSNNDDWYATFDTPFVDNNYCVICTPHSSSAVCPTSWYTVSQTANGFRLFCLGNVPLIGFEYIAIRN